MKSARELHQESLARADIILNGKGNPNHDPSSGRFSSGGGSGSGGGISGDSGIKKGTVTSAPGLKSRKEANELTKESLVKNTVYLVASGKEAGNIEKKGVTDENMGELHGFMASIKSKHTPTKGVRLMDAQDAGALTAAGDAIVSVKLNVKNPASFKDSGEYFDAEKSFLKSLGKYEGGGYSDSGIFKNHLLETNDAILIGGNTDIYVKSPSQVIPTSIKYR